jgi:P-type Cu2+ transporter
MTQPLLNPAMKSIATLPGTPNDATSPSITASAQACFHCGEAVPAGARYVIHYQGANQPACCIGCQAVGQTIIDSGNADYYRLRTDLPKTAEAAL